MNKLYQYIFGTQPHYVVATSYGDAEKAIKKYYPSTSEPMKIECLGQYIIISDVARNTSND